jgi:hypothetical protein
MALSVAWRAGAGGAAGARGLCGARTPSHWRAPEVSWCEGQRGLPGARRVLTAPLASRRLRPPVPLGVVQAGVEAGRGRAWLRGGRASTLRTPRAGRGRAAWAGPSSRTSGWGAARDVSPATPWRDRHVPPRPRGAPPCRTHACAALAVLPRARPRTAASIGPPEACGRPRRRMVGGASARGGTPPQATPRRCACRLLGAPLRGPPTGARRAASRARAGPAQPGAREGRQRPGPRPPPSREAVGADGVVRGAPRVAQGPVASAGCVPATETSRDPWTASRPEHGAHTMGRCAPQRYPG